MFVSTDSRQNITQTQRKLLVLAIDAAEPTLLDAWTRDGTLPHIRALMDSGLTGETRGVDALYVGATWPSFYTGVNPGKHGLYWLEQLVPGSYRTRKLRAKDFARRPALWDLLSSSGRHVIVADVPLTRCTPGLNGMQIVEWGVHDAAFGFQTEPVRHAKTLHSLFGAHPAPSSCDAPVRSTNEYVAFAAQLIQGAQARSALTRHLLATEPWDFAMQVFSEAHCAGHQLWHFHDRLHPAYDPAITADAGDLLRDVYVSVDSAIGEIVNTIGDDVTVVLMSLHGMSFMAGHGALLDEILVRLGYTASFTSASRATNVQSPASVARRVLRGAARLYRQLPQAIRRPIYDVRQHVNRSWLDRGDALNVDAAGSKCFKCELGAAVSGIRLNLEGREPHGVIRPGKDASDLAEEVTSQLLEIVDARKRRPLINRIFQSKDLFHGDRLDDLPDLIIEWNLSEPVGTTAIATGERATMLAHSARIGLVEYVNAYCRTGEHRINGMFVARGPGIVPGRMSTVTSTLDLTTTFAHMFGCTIPDGDGAVINELLQRQELRPSA